MKDRFTVPDWFGTTVYEHDIPYNLIQRFKALGFIIDDYIDTEAILSWLHDRWERKQQDRADEWLKEQ